MSYKAMLRHRCTIMEQTLDLDSGSPTYQWTEVKRNVRCFVDLNFIRHGKDRMWTPEAGRPTERSGVAFFLPRENIKIGQWIKVTKGPAGVFSLETTVDEAWRPTDKHHLEVGVVEIPKMLVPNQGAPVPPPAPIPVPTMPLPPELDEV